MTGWKRPKFRYGQIPRSNDVNTFWNYGMTADEIAEYLRKKEERRKEEKEAPLLQAAE
jgi:hypothetical protein